MSIIEIELTPEMEKSLRKKALLRGLEANAYARSLVIQDLSQDEVLAKSQRPFNVMKFYGAGQEALRELDVQKYVADLRDDWDK